ESTVAAFVGGDTVLACLRRVIGTTGLRVDVQLLPPRTGTDRRALARAVQRDVSRARGMAAERERRPHLADAAG
ncbi:MAG TPA: hypothetical protein VE172_04240, partial [Stackebrandtia sp.]